MNNIIQFPTSPATDWRIIERQVCDAMESAQMSSVAQEHMLAGLRPFCELVASFKFDFSISAEFPGSINRKRINAVCADIGQKIGKAISDQFSDFQLRLVAERTDREIQNCRDAGLL